MEMKFALFVSLMVAALAIPISGAQRMGYLIEIHGIVYCPGSNNTNASAIPISGVQALGYDILIYGTVYCPSSSSISANAIPISGVQALGYDILIYGTVYCPSSSSISANGINKRPVFPCKFVQMLKYMSCVEDKWLLLPLPMATENFWLPWIIN
ncbi:hypothetical protein CFP56_008395, partial [Quercus suber]